MKKLILCFLCLLLLCGCGSREVEPSLYGISFDASVLYGDYECALNIELQGNGSLRSTMTEPQSVAGTEIRYDGEGVEITYMGLTYTPKLPLPNETVNDVLSKILTSVSSGAANATEEDDRYVINGTAAGYDYSLFVTESGLPLSLVCEQLDFTAEFSNVTVKK